MMELIDGARCFCTRPFLMELQTFALPSVRRNTALCRAAIGFDTPFLVILSPHPSANTKNRQHWYHCTSINSKLELIPSTKLNLPITYIVLFCHPMKGTAICFSEFRLVFSE